MDRMKRICIFAIPVLGLCGCAAKPKQPVGFAQYPQLKAATGRAAKNQPQPQEPRILPETHYAAGRVFEQQGSPDKAIEQYRKAVAVNHQYTAAYARLGLMLSVTGQHEEAAAALSRAVELKPGSAVLRNNLGFELLYLERWDEAERHLREATILDPKLTQASINLGLLLGRTGRPQEALSSFMRAVPEPDACYNLGLLQRAQGQYIEAAQSFEHVLTINPAFTAAQRQLAQIQRKVDAAKMAAGTTTQTPDTGTAPASESGIAQPPFPQTTSAPLIDLGTLINEIVTEPSTTETINTNPDTAAGATTITPSADDIPTHETAGTDERVIPAATQEPEPQPEDTAKKTDAARAEPTALAVPEADENLPAPQIRPLRWDLNLGEMAAALNTYDSQVRCIEEVQTITSQLGPVPAELEPADLVVGPPAIPQEGMFVLGTSETRTPIEIDQAAVAARLSPEGQRTLRTLDDMEISLQIIRNEIQCQKEFGACELEEISPVSLGGQGTLEYTPIQWAPLPADQRTQLWNSQFRYLEDLLTFIQAETRLARGNGMKVVPVQTTQNDAGPGILAAPPTNARKSRWSGVKAAHND